MIRKYKQIYLFIFIFFNIIACNDGKSVEKHSLPSQVIIIDQKEDTIKFKVLLPNGKKISNILKKQHITHDWMLTFGLIDTYDVQDIEISSDEYRFLLETSLDFMQKNFQEQFQLLASIKIPFFLNKDVKKSIIETVKNTVRDKDLKENIFFKNRILDTAVRETLNSFEVVDITCQALTCDKYKADMIPVIFKSDVLHKEWHTLIDLPDAGLDDRNHISIGVIPLKKN